MPNQVAEKQDRDKKHQVTKHKVSEKDRKYPFIASKYILNYMKVIGAASNPVRAS